MAIGKEIKVVLTLDTSSFDAKSKASRESVSALNTVFSEVGKTSSKLDTLIATLTKGFGSLTESSAGLEKTIQTIANRADTTSGKLNKLAQEAKKVNLEWAEIGAFTPGIERGLNGVGKSAAATAVSIAQLKPSLAAAAQGFKELDKASTDSAKLAKDMATQAIEAKLTVLNNERTVNAEIIASREASLRALQTAQNSFTSQAMAKGIEADNVRRTRVRGSALKANLLQGESDGFSNSAQIAKKESAAIDTLLPKLRQEQQERNAAIATLEKQHTATQQLIKDKETLSEIEMYVGRKNAAELKRITADRLSNDKVAGNARAQMEHETAEKVKQYWTDVNRVQQGHINSTASLVKNMAQLWGAAKVEQGFKASIKDADDYARVLERIDAAGIDGAAGKARLLTVSDAVKSANPNLSKTESLKLTMSGAAGTVSTDTAILTKIMPEIGKVMTVMQRQFPEQAHNLEDFGRNVMGVMEARGITEDAPKMLKTLDNLSRALILTQGKMAVQDYETISRRGGVGNAQLKDDESILYDIAAASQMKVMGGGGGGAGGVSVFANMQKMAAKRAQGGTRETKSALANLVEFDIIDKEKLLEANGGKVGKNYTPVPWNKSSDAANNTTKWAMDLVHDLKIKLAATPESDTRFFPAGADRKDDKAQAQAVGSFFDRSVGNTSVAEFFKMMATKGSQERIQKEVDASKAAPAYEESHIAAMKAWDVQVKITQASLTDLGIVVGRVLIPVLQPVLELIGKIVNSLASFGTNNPSGAAFAVTAVAIAAVTLGLKGMIGMFGLAGSVISNLTGMSTSATGVASSMTKATESAGLFAGAQGKMSAAAKELQKDLATSVPTLTKVGSTISEKVASAASRIGPAFAEAGKDMAAAGSGLISTAARIGTGVLRALPVIGQIALIFTLVEAIANMEVGGATLITWAIGFADRFTSTFEIMALRVQGLWNATANNLADMREAELEARLIANGLKAPKAKGVTEYENPAQAEARMDKEYEEVQKRKKIDAERAKLAEQRKLAEEKAAAALARVTSGGSGARPDFGQTKADKADRDHVDPLDRAIAEAEGAVGKQAEKLRALLKGAEDVDSLRAQVIEDLNGKREAGNFNKDRLAKNPVAENDPKFQKLIEIDTQKLLQSEQIKAVEFAEQRLAASTYEMNEAMSRLASDGSVKQSDALKALNKELERAEKRLGAGAKGWSEWEAVKSAALSMQAKSDFLNYGEEIRKSTTSKENSLKEDPKERVAGELAATEKLARDHYEKLLADSNAYSEKQIADQKSRLAESKLNGQARFDLELDVASKIQAETDNSLKVSMAVEKHRTEELKQLALVRQRALEEPIVGLARTWKQTAAQLEVLQDSWANGFVNMITQGMQKGRLEIGSFVKGILMDIATVKLKEVLADPLRDGISMATDYLKQSLFPSAERKRILGSFGNESGSGIAGAKAADKAGEITDAATDSLSKFSTETGQTTSALSKMATDGAEKATEALVQSAATAATEESASLVFAETLDFASAALEQFIASLESSGGGAGAGGFLSQLFGGAGETSAGAGVMDAGTSLGGLMIAANGGILDQYGSVELRKYAAGGIARSPQLALYGEAGPEAYVPLPDGRSIPVTMQGGSSAPPITVNVINQSGTQVSASKGEPRFDGRQMVLDVVLSAASSPGPFRDGLKGAVGGR